MSWRNFALRRLVRLQPMVVFGTLIGALFYYPGASVVCPLVDQTTLSHLLIVTVMGCLMLPVSVGYDVRGWQETYPLNGPT